MCQALTILHCSVIIVLDGNMMWRYLIQWKRGVNENWAVLYECRAGTVQLKIAKLTNFRSSSGLSI